MKNIKDEERQNKISTRWMIFFVASIIIVTIGSIVNKSSIGLAISSICGIIYTMLIAKEFRISFLFGLVNVITYGYILFIQNMYGGVIFNWLYSIPMLTFGFIKWKKVENDENSGVKNLRTSTKVVIGLIFIVIITIYSLILKSSGGNYYVLDGIISSLSFLAVYFVSNKYIEQWLVWIIVNVTGCILWGTLTIQTIQNLPLLFMWIIHLINSVYAYIVWNKKYKST